MAKSDVYQAQKPAKPVPPGTHNMRVLSIIDCGTQAGFKPEYPAKPDLLYTFELVDTDEDFGKGYGEPFTRSLNFNPILGTQKGGTKPTKYRDFLQKLLGKVIKPNESIARIKLINLACKGTFVEEDDLKAYQALIDGGSDPDKTPMPTKVIFQGVGFVTPAQGKLFAPVRNPLIYFELPSEEDPNPECKYKKPEDKQGEVLSWLDCFELLHKWQQKKIAVSPEFIKGIALAGFRFDEEGEAGNRLVEIRKPRAVAAQPSASQDADVNDDIPF